MAEAYLRQLAGDTYEVESAGLEPGKLNPYVVEALQEDGIDISTKQTQGVFDLWKAGNTYRYVITVCSKEAEERCPIFPGAVVRYHWPFDDPSQFKGSHDEILARVRIVRDQIKEKIRRFIADPLNPEGL